MFSVLLIDFASDSNFNAHRCFATPPHYPLIDRHTSYMETEKRHLELDEAAKSTTLAPLKKLRVTAPANDSFTTGSPEHEVKINRRFLQRIMELMIDL